MVPFLILLLCTAVASAEIRGRVIDSSLGEPLARIKVAAVDSGQETVTGPQGEFLLPLTGAVRLRISGVGYRPYELTVQSAENKQIEIALHPDTLRHSESVRVTAGPFPEEATASLRGAASASNAGLLMEGPVGRARRGSWLIAARKPPCSSASPSAASASPPISAPTSASTKPLSATAGNSPSSPKSSISPTVTTCALTT
ncbi:MAG: carboxypeptidase-like regulatory domain-containing protein [Acidimicrobiia bacterium]|nr:carboxypeptidase-like regulatory domain-containing protein [Acidimicrobiia bacterium]